MPERNRVTPLGDIVATPLRGAWTGNRGVLHRGHRIVRCHAGDLWITCVLEFRGRWREQWLPGRYTHLYFHDEAVSLAAGHRPCAECRRADYLAYRGAWAGAYDIGRPTAQALNRTLQAERIVRGTHRRLLHGMPWADLPDGTFTQVDGASCLVLGDTLVEWTRAGYAGVRARPTTGEARVITPPVSVAVLRSGYPVQVDGTAYALAGRR